MQVLVLVVVVHMLVSEMEEVVHKLVLEIGVAQGMDAPAHCACMNLEIR